MKFQESCNEVQFNIVTVGTHLVRLVERRFAPNTVVWTVLIAEEADKLARPMSVRLQAREI